MGLEASDRCPLRERRGVLAIQRHREIALASDSEGGGWADAVTNTWLAPETRSAWEDLPTLPQEGARPAHTFIPDLWCPELEENKFLLS